MSRCRGGAALQSCECLTNGAISGFQYGGLSTVTHAMTQNARQLPARSFDANVGPGAWTILDDNYTYDGNGNVASITDAAQNFKRTMGYDGLDRLTVANSDNLGTPTAFDGPFGQAAFAYDPLDNLRSLDQATTHFRYNYDANWRLSNITNSSGTPLYSFTHDARGNMLSKNAQDFVFDRANRMSSAETTALSGSQVYRYDGLGRRVQTTDANNATTFWLYSQAGQVMYSSEARRSRNIAYIYLGNTQVATRTVEWAPLNTVAVRFQFTDALGSPVASANATADSASVLRTNYTPYGEAIAPAVVDGTGYTGHVMDQATGLTYMQQRYYDGLSGRFLSVDPVDASSGNFNRYWYADNNPYSFTDPDGRESACFSNNSGCGLRPATAEDNQKVGTALGGLVAMTGLAGGVATLGMAAVAEVSQYGVVGAVLGNPETVVTAGAVAVEGAAGIASGGGVPSPSPAAGVVTVEQKAAQLAGRAGANSVTVKTGSGQIRVDLQGEAHYSKATSAQVPTPHVVTYKNNVIPSGPRAGQVGRITQVGQVAPATKQDLKAIQRVLEARSEP